MLASIYSPFSSRVKRLVYTRLQQTDYKMEDMDFVSSLKQLLTPYLSPIKYVTVASCKRVTLFRWYSKPYKPRCIPRRCTFNVASRPRINIVYCIIHTSHVGVPFTRLSLSNGTEKHRYISRRSRGERHQQDIPLSAGKTSQPISRDNEPPLSRRESLYCRVISFFLGHYAPRVCVCACRSA